MIDDEEGIRRSLLRLLRSAGLEAHAFVSGKVFLGSLESRQPACVLLDLHMLDMSGFAVIEQLALIAPELPVVILTGQEVSERQRNADLAHALAVLQKPVDDQELFATIATVLMNPNKQALSQNDNLAAHT
ncbi:response regulator [Undibacterium sp. YM2]|uniref:response regulator n=1 Tax=Undibacterium sp. YM2 TaxID=2058625 RepID=UPI00138A1224|nr:response regulator [Undibacterium sp. YM2]